MPAKIEQASASGQISGAGRNSGIRAAQGGAERRIDNPEAVTLRQEGMLKRNAGFNVVSAFHIGDIGAKARIRKLTILGYARALKEQTKIIERIRTREVVVMVSPNESSKRK